MFVVMMTKVSPCGIAFLQTLGNYFDPYPLLLRPIRAALNRRKKGNNMEANYEKMLKDSNQIKNYIKGDIANLDETILTKKENAKKWSALEVPNCFLGWVDYSSTPTLPGAIERPMAIRFFISCFDVKFLT